MPRIVSIKTVEHARQRYPTCGDWQFLNGGIYVKVSALPDWRYELLVGIHEVVEAALCKHRGISEEAVTAFDVACESDDPGAQAEAPYHKEHMFAERVERLIAEELGVDWHAYEDALP